NRQNRPHIPSFIINVKKHSRKQNNLNRANFLAPSKSPSLQDFQVSLVFQGLPEPFSVFRRSVKGYLGSGAGVRKQKIREKPAGRSKFRQQAVL
ncbi:MAG: hypothetical protein Q4G14_05185, partial [Paracoccus sp. (in: a-proteobacteria)]|uniref:hypothetical protein n=1 Tax=Paracoccus sp. TaxID=267 RepID=UPI0026DEB49C